MVFYKNDSKKKKAIDTYSIKAIITNDELEEIPDGKNGFSNLKKIVLNYGIKRLGKEAFQYSNIEEIRCPPTLKEIDDRCFWLCKDLKKIYLNIGLERLGERALSDTKLTTIDCPSTLKEIGDFCFHSCRYLDTANLNEGIETLGEFVFYGTPLRSVKIPSTLRYIRYACFADCERLRTVEFAEGLEGLGRCMFSGTSVDNIKCPSTLKKIGHGCFCDCHYLKTVMLNEGLEELGGSAFSNTRLEKVELPSSVKNVGDNCFSNCDNLVITKAQTDEVEVSKTIEEKTTEDSPMSNISDIIKQLTTGVTTKEISDMIGELTRVMLSPEHMNFCNSKGKKFSGYLIHGEGNVLPYILVIPEEMKDDKELIVESLNFEGTDIIENIVPHVFEQLKNGVEVFDESPILVPFTPDVRGGRPYYQQLSRECFEESKNGEYEIKFPRVDLQIIDVINNAKKVVMQKTSKKVAEKIFLNGYSASGVFAQRFALIHPEIVGRALIGGASGTIPLPTEEFDYPIRNKKFQRSFWNRF